MAYGTHDQYFILMPQQVGWTKCMSNQLNYNLMLKRIKGDCKDEGKSWDMHNVSIEQ